MNNQSLKTVPYKPEGLLKELPPPDGKSGFPWTQESVPISKQELEATQFPRLSIVTPSYNQGQFIEETIRSVLLQNYPNLEYIIIDGGSTDETVEILRKYDAWISHWVSEPDTGQSNAINKGLRLSSGEIVAYINSDDYYFPRAFQHAVEVLTEANADLFSGEVMVIPSNELFRKPELNELKDWLRHVYCSIGQPGAFWRKRAEYPEFDESLNCAFDRDFFMQLSRRGAKIVTSEQVTAAFRIHGASKTSRLEEQFSKENTAINNRMLEHLPASDQAEMREHLRVQALRHRFHAVHQLSFASSQELGKVVRSYPTILLKREFYGKLKRLLNNSSVPEDRASIE